jgi:hypothetical protein
MLSADILADGVRRAFGLPLLIAPVRKNQKENVKL